MQFASYKELPKETRTHLLALEVWIGEMDGKTICTPTDGDTFIDEGTVDAGEAVKAFNEIVALLRQKQ